MIMLVCNEANGPATRCDEMGHIPTILEASQTIADQAPAIHENRMQFSNAFSNMLEFCSRFWNISAIYYPILKR